MKVLNMKTDNWSNAVYVGRPSKWGNPYVIGKDGTRKEVVNKYKLYFYARHDLVLSLHELRNKDLACWCSRELCHADFLVELANR